MKDHGRAQETVVILVLCVRSSSTFVGFFVGCWTPGGDEGLIGADGCQACGEQVLPYRYDAMLARERLSMLAH